MTKVAIGAGHPVIMGVIRLSCSSIAGVEIVGEASSTTDVVELCRTQSPDLLVLELDLEDGDGLDALRTLYGEGVELPVLALSDRTDGAAVLDAMRVGVRGYLGKTHELRDIADAIRRVASGEKVIAPGLERAAMVALGRLARRAREGSEMSARLSPREREILLLMSDGLTMRQVARRLSISQRTVETHVAKLYRKLGVRTRMQAIARASSLGLIDLR
ncbi:MAG: response regulator transcription factor [Actinomycetota bacterium]|nr:response regulator transcription factor [Actinomycetota bacterium]